METIENFLRVSYGDGYGYGYGDGDGYGDGYGYGYGDGDGYGSGYGYGYGYGSGYGSGSGSGSGSGYGSGYGDGIIQFNKYKVYDIDCEPTIITHIHGNIAQGYVLSTDLTLTPCYVAKFGNFFAHGNTAREAMRDARKKYEANLPVSERISRFIDAYPTLDTVCCNSDLFVAHNRLTGSCEMGRREFCRSHGLSLDGEMTVADFIDLTAGEYGGDIIRQLKKAYR